MFSNAFGCIYSVYYYIGSIFQCNSMQLLYISMYFECNYNIIMVYFGVFVIYLNVFKV
jgi:hypothetical protein